MGTEVYSVEINAEQQVVRVTGNADPATLIKKPVKSGKYAQPWSSIPNQNHREMANFINDGNYHYQNLLNASGSQPMLTYGRNIQDQLAFERYLKQGMGMEAVNEERQMSIMAAPDMETGDLGCYEDAVADEGGTGFAGLQEFDPRLPAYHPPFMMNTMCGDQFNQPSPLIMNHMGTMMMQDNNYMRQSQMVNHTVPSRYY